MKHTKPIIAATLSLGTLCLLAALTPEVHMASLKETNKKIEHAATGTYHKIEDAVTGTYQKIEDKFVDTFLRADGETIAEAKERLRAEACTPHDSHH